jgi:hypothetical protein
VSIVNLFGYVGIGLIVGAEKIQEKKRTKNEIHTLNPKTLKDGAMNAGTVVIVTEARVKKHFIK